MMLGGYARFKERNMVRSETLSAQGKQCVFRVFLPHQCRDFRPKKHHKPTS